MRLMKTMSAASLLVLLSTGLASAVPARVETPLNVRSGEGTQFPVIATMPAGAVVDASNCGDGWCYISEYGGFASASYLELSGGAYGAGPVTGSVGVYVNPTPWAGYRDPYYGGAYGYYEPHRYGYAPGERIIRRGIRELGREIRRDARADWRQNRHEWRQHRRDSWRNRHDAQRDARQDRR